MKNYTTFEAIACDLKRLDLERQIAFEELKGIKGDVQEDLKPLHWMQTVFKFIAKYSSVMLLKKIIR